jgi:hypothetical protein
MLKSKNIRRSVKMQIYKTLKRPVVTYGSETWTLTKSDENLLRIFERKILQKIYGMIQEGDIWQIRNNEELNSHKWRGYCEIHKRPKDKMAGTY